MADMARPMPGAGSTAATLHFPPPPPPPPPHELPLLLLLLLQPPPLQPPPPLPLLQPLLQPPLLLLPLEPPLHELPQPLLPPLPLEPPLQLPPEELELPPPQPPPPPPPLPLDVHALQLPPHPLWSLELEQALSHDSELLQLGPEQSQVGDALQLLFWLLLLHELPQLTEVDRGGSLEVLPASRPGN
jgi:hypothetical protein